MLKLCFGCMKLKENSPICERCGYDERSSNSSHQLPVGTKVGGQYILGRVLGQGGFGITYSGWDMVLNMPVAVKEYFPSGYAGRDTRNPTHVTSYDNHSSHDFEHNKQRFLREAETLGKLWNTPQIVRILRHFEENGTAYIAMEYVEGMDLRKYLKQLGRPMTVSETLKVLGPVMEALEQVHKAELVHRDISPDNIMVLPDGSAKLLDFGAARYVENADAERERNTSTQAILKHGFAPPEQYQSHGALGPWTDVYAMCGTIYYCLTGKVPTEAMTRFADGAAINWAVIPGLTPQQCQALDTGMSLQAKDRFAKIQDLWNALRPAPAPKKETVKPKTDNPQNDKPKTAAPDTKTPGVVPAEKKKSKLLPFVAAIAAVLLICAGILIIKENSTFIPKKDSSISAESNEDYRLVYSEKDSQLYITGYNGTLPSSLEIPGTIDEKTVVSIEPHAFKGCMQLTSVTLPDSVSTIGNWAFQGCSNLTEVNLPGRLTSIGDYAFHSCTSLNTIHIPKTVIRIGSYAFESCTGLSQVAINRRCDISNTSFPNGCTVSYK